MTAISPPLPSSNGRALALDLLERGFLLLLGGWMVARFAPDAFAHPLNLLLLASELLMVVFVLVRRFGPAVNTGRAWGVAVIGTCAPLLVSPVGTAFIPAAVASTMLAAGMAFSVAAKLVLRRSFGIVAANRGVQLGGPYRLVRHPMYLGYLLAHAGFLLATFSAWNVAVYAACWLAMLLRIDAEEGILRADPVYRDYAARVRARLVPGIW